MQASGNGAAVRCVANLLRTRRGEVPFARLKGLDGALIDRPGVNTRPLLEADAEQMLAAYEPRAALEGIQLEPEQLQSGHWALRAEVATNE